MFIIDFDDTLFNTQAFKQARLEAVQRLGITDDEFWQTYRIARNSPDGNFTYTNERHAEVLAMRGYNRAEVLSVLESTTGEMLASFVFPDTFSFLEELKKLGQPMILLSLGNPGFQELKTKGAGVEKYFDRIFMIHTTKEYVLEELFDSVDEEKVWFINDKVDETKKLVKSFSGKLKPIMKVSEKASVQEYKQATFPYFETLTEIKDYIMMKQSR